MSNPGLHLTENKWILSLFQNTLNRFSIITITYLIFVSGIRWYTLGKSFNRSPGNFYFLEKRSNIRKSQFSRERYIILDGIILDGIYQIFILIDQLTQFPSR